MPSRSTFFFSRRNARSTGSPFFNLISVNATHFLPRAGKPHRRLPQNKRTRRIIFPRTKSMCKTAQQKPIPKIEQQRNKATKVEIPPLRQQSWGRGPGEVARFKAVPVETESMHQPSAEESDNFALSATTATQPVRRCKAFQISNNTPSRLFRH